MGVEPGVNSQVKNTKQLHGASEKHASAAPHISDGGHAVMSKKIRYAGEVFSGYNKPKKTKGQEVCSS